MAAEGAALLVVDGECAMCSVWGGFVLRFDRRRRLLLATTQSVIGRTLYTRHAQDPDATNLLIQGGRVRVKSDAVIGVLELMGGPWRAATVFRAIPRAWRDAAYDWVARHRLRLFGRRDVCWRPAAADMERFLS